MDFLLTLGGQMVMVGNCISWTSLSSDSVVSVVGFQNQTLRVWLMPRMQKAAQERTSKLQNRRSRTVLEARKAPKSTTVREHSNNLPKGTSGLSHFLVTH